MIIRFENHIFYDFFTHKGKDAEKLALFNRHFKFNPTQRWKNHEFRVSAESSAPGATADWKPQHVSMNQALVIVVVFRLASVPLSYHCLSPSF
jgi:hypothetical protein